MEPDISQVLSPLRGCALFLTVSQGLTPLAILCRSYGAEAVLGPSAPAGTGRVRGPTRRRSGPGPCGDAVLPQRLVQLAGVEAEHGLGTDHLHRHAGRV